MMKTIFPSYDLVKKYFYINFFYQFQEFTDLEPVDNCFVKNESDYISSFENIYSIEPLYFKWKNYHFPVFIHQNENSLITQEGKISFDIYLNVFLFLSGWLEIISTSKDQHNRFPFKASLQYKCNFIEIPVVNIYFEILYEIAKGEKITLERKKNKNSIIFSHDIDQLRSGWFENIQHELKNFSFKSIYKIPKNLLIKILNLKDPYYKGMERMLEIDKKHNIDSISFLLAKKSHSDADFDISKNFSNIIEQTCRDQEIGIHPGYETYDNEIEFQNQINIIETVSNHKIKKSRQHFLRFDIKKTPKILEFLSIKEDYSLGFAEHYGFRNSVATPFHLFCFEKQSHYNTIYIPLVFMDVSLVNYNLNKSFNESFDFIENSIENFDCNFSILFHNSVFSENKYKGFENFYLKLIKLNKALSTRKQAN